MKSGRLFWFIAVAVVMVCASGCKKREPSTPTPVTGNFVLQIQGMYGSKPFNTDSFYTDPAGRVLLFNQGFQFYLSNIYLAETNGSIDTVAPVAIFYFPNVQNPLSPSSNLSVSLNNVKGDFKAITFGVGLDSLQNLSNPDTVESQTNPLSAGYGMYWIMLDYQFETVNGFWWPNTSKVTQNGLTYHVGTNTVYRHTTLNTNFSVCCGNTTTLNLILDVEKIFFAGADTLDINQITMMSNAAEDSVGSAFATNFANAFSIAQ